jgi:HTH-type transcriptional regulator, competence development regulator
MTTKQEKHFGQVLREKRTAKGHSLRKFAELVGISPTYLSQVEQGTISPPTADRVQRMAEILGENADDLVALAGRVPKDLPKIIREQPQEMATFLREASGLSAEQIQQLISHARKLKGGDEKQ